MTDSNPSTAIKKKEDGSNLTTFHKKKLVKVLKSPFTIDHSPAIGRVESCCIETDPPKR